MAFKDCEYLVDEHTGLILQEVLEEMFSDVLDVNKEDIHNHREALLKIVNNPE